MIPLVPSAFRHRPRPSLEARMERTLAAVRAERPELALDAELRAFVPTTLERAPTLHLDDQSAIFTRSTPGEWSYIQDRARLRAQTGDFVAASHQPPPGYESYCQSHLGLGKAAWLAPKQEHGRTNLASHCWADRDVRSELVRLLRADALRFLHPLMGSRDVWQLARMLQRVSRRPIHVIAPPPAVTHWVNDKIEFARLIHRLFGERWLPPTRSCSSLATLSQMVRDLAEDFEAIAIKVPDAAGGRGNLVVSAERVRGRPLKAIYSSLRRLVRKTGWQGGRHLLVGAWETDVLSTPSAQLWLPPPPDPPVVEGIFEQLLEGVAGEFVGSRPADLPAWVLEEIAERSWLVGRLFQGLGYLGRCSFDFVLVGPQLDRSRLEFIECNGRWGGTSLPMTLVNRLLPVSAPRHYIISALPLPDSHPVGFSDLLEHLEDLLFDVRTGQGRLVLFNPLRTIYRGDVNLIAFGRTAHDAQYFVAGELKARLRDLRGRRASTSPNPRVPQTA